MSRQLQNIILYTIIFLFCCGWLGWDLPSVSDEDVNDWRLNLSELSEKKNINKHPPRNELKTPIWAVEVRSSTDPSRLAERLGGEYIQKVFGLGENLVLLKFPGSEAYENSRSVAKIIARQPDVQWYEQQIARQMYPRTRPAYTRFDDPLFNYQWHLLNRGQSGGTNGEDINVYPAWDNGYLGDGVLVGVVDDGMEFRHPDLSLNYRADFSRDFNGGDLNPSPTQTEQYHGTAVAGLIGARDNGKLGVGVAPRSGLAGLRLISRPTTDAEEAEALSYKRDSIDIYNASWGPEDSSRVKYHASGSLLQNALERSVQLGRGGLGNIYVWAAGNGGAKGDNANYDGYGNLPWNIAVASVDQFGRQCSFSEPGSSVLICAPSDGAGADIVTTDLLGRAGQSLLDYTTGFGGTSASAPLVTGAIALMLEANPSLTWRDVQHILVRTAVKNDPLDDGWSYNAAGYHVNHKFGFGRVDAAAAVALAHNWKTIPNGKVEYREAKNVRNWIPDNTGYMLYSTDTVEDSRPVEHVRVKLWLDHYSWGDLEIILRSPSGTESKLAAPFSRGDGPEHLLNGTSSWTYLTVHNWGESAAGEWTLFVRDSRAGNSGQLISWQLILHLVDSTSDKMSVLPLMDDHFLIPRGFQQAVDVLHNEGDLGSKEDLRIISLYQPPYGYAFQEGYRDLKYTPGSEFSNIDIIGYTVMATDGRIGQAHLTLEVPDRMVLDKTAAVARDSPLLINLSLDDYQFPVGKEFHVQVTQNPDHGSVEVDDAGRVTYVPTPGYRGPDHFAYALTQDHQQYSAGTVSVHVAMTENLSLDLNGVDESVVLAVGDRLDLTGPFTLEAWIHPTSWGNVANRGFARIFDKEIFSFFLCNEPPALDEETFYYNKRCLALWLQLSNGNYAVFSTPDDSVQLGQWQHVAFSYGEDGTCKIYINGVEQLLTNPLSQRRNLVRPSTPLVSNRKEQLVAGGTYAGIRLFEGLIDDFRIWNTIRTPQQIAAWRLTGPPRDTSGLYAHWPVDGGHLPTLFSIDSVKSTAVARGTSWADGIDRIRYFFPNMQRSGNGWCSSSWLGVFNESNYPWIYHSDHGFLYLHGGAATNFWLHGQQTGWLWTSQDFYPWIWSQEIGAWTWYLKGSSKPRMFYDSKNEDWKTDALFK